MKPRKLHLLLTALALALCLAAAPALAANKAQALKQGAQELNAIICSTNGREIMHNVKLYKEAGLAYQPSLTAPLQEILRCKSKEQLRVLLGVYTFDANYALLFGKKKEFIATNQLLRKTIPERLDMAGKIKVKTFTPKEFRRILDNPNDPANRALYSKLAMDNLALWIQAAQTDQEILDVLVDAFYGATIEGLYVACKLALGAGSGGKLRALFNEQTRRMGATQQMLEIYADNPELAKLVERGQRQAVLKPVLSLLRAKKGALSQADLKKLLSLVEPERNNVIAKCK